MYISAATEKEMTSQNSRFSCFLVVSPIHPLIINTKRIMRKPKIQRQSGFTRMAKKIMENNPLAPAYNILYITGSFSVMAQE
jgi:hypothetical protein